MGKRRIAAGLVLLLALCVAGCSKYASDYRAVGFVHSNTAEEASMSFMTFRGTIVFRLLNGKADTGIVCRGKLDSGELTAYYDCGGGKTELFALRGGGTTDTFVGELPEGRIWIVVETDGECEDGSLVFGIEG